jgi:ABC-type uncharacterized transport system ATPase subunit
MPVLLEMKDIHKTYPGGTAANRGIDLAVHEGEIHALVGENGAGKSTLMKILFGLESPTRGEIIYQGRQGIWDGPGEAIKQGMGMVHQHFMLVPSLTVSENIVLGHEPKKGMLRMFRDRASEKAEVQRLMQTYGLKVDPEARVENIPVGQKQRVEILKVLYRGARVIILDEPTAVLTPQETDELFDSVKALADQGHTIIFITHKLREVMRISNRVTVLRAGRSVATLMTAETSREEISRLMVGREVLTTVERKPAVPGEAVLSVRGLLVSDDRGYAALKGVSFDVRAGEILGIAGVEGNGQTELAEAIAGLRRTESGEIVYLDRSLRGVSAAKIRRLGVGHIPEDRQTSGASLTSTIAENLILDHYRNPAFKRGPFLSKRKIMHFADSLMQTFDVRAESGNAPAGSLSGGNLQKVVIARELSKNPKLLIAAQPTRGVDIGAIEFIHREIVKQRDAGAAVLLISAELSEVMGLSDRIAVLYNGEIAAVLENAAGLTEQEVGYYMLGIKTQEQGAAK